jgi:SM-20-related protein
MKIANIDVFDGLVYAAFRVKIFSYIMASKFLIGWADASYGPKSTYKFLHAPFSKEELIASGLGDIIFSAPEIAPFIKGKEMVKCMVNLTQAGDVQFTHSHPVGETVVLYYANLDWLPEWWGETMFYNDDQSSIVHAARYTPGRIVVFDGTIPHAIRPQSTIGPQYRFTVTTIFTEVKPKVET